MKYIIRSAKYLIWFCAIFFLILCVLIATTEGQSLETVFDPEIGMFRAGSFPKIIIFFVAVAAIYPMMGFTKKELAICGSFADNEDLIRKQLETSGYELVSEDPTEMVFRLKNRFTRFMRMFEDHIIITKQTPVVISGFRKDAFRIASAVEFHSRKRAEN